MRRSAFAVAAFLLLVAVGSRLARADEPQAPVPAPSGSATSAAPGAAGATAPDAAAASADAWRFRRHNGQWWYWLPSNKWVVWNGTKWEPYVAQATAQTQRVQPSRRYYYPPQQGNWGPVQYDRWGNRQYPYSRRTTGLQQLGPVPAMGGVRSLPGWGGER